MRHLAFLATLLLVPSLAAPGRAGAQAPRVRRLKKETIDYHVIPKLRPNPSHTAHELVVRRSGPLLSLVLEQPGKPRHVQDIFVRTYRLEHPVPGAYYDIRVRREDVLLDGARAETSEIVWVRLNGKQLYPCGGFFRDPCGRPGGCMFCRGKMPDSLRYVDD